MKKRIEKILEETFEYDAPKLLVSEKEIRAEVKKNENYRGSFKLENSAQRKMKGLLYSSNLRMGYEPQAFHGFEEKIIFEADTAGMQNGDVLDGFFTVCSDLGEEKIPYHITIKENALKTSAEHVEDLDHFVQLAKEDFQKAYVIFVSDIFRELLTKKEPAWIPLYEGLMAQDTNYAALEEFLVGIGAKERVSFSMERSRITYDELIQTELGKVGITKENWGFQRLEVRTVGAFLKVEHPVITTEEFIGSTYQLEYLLNIEKLHKGRNYGRIEISTPSKTLVCEITVHNTGEKEKHLLKQQRQVEFLEKKYIEHMLGRLEPEQWLQESKAALEEYEKQQGGHPMLLLYKAYLYFELKKEEEACMILEEVDERRDWMVLPEVQAYYLYLTTFYNKDKDYEFYVLDSLMELHVQNPENWMVLWTLLYLKESYSQHPTERLEAVRQQFIRGCRSRVLYVEAWKIFVKNPILIKNFGEFELQVLRFICREEMLTDELIMQIGDVAYRWRQYSKELLKILKTCYEKKPSDNLVRAICSVLIKGNKTEPDTFQWYEKAVKADLRITGLYEYYIESMGEKSTEQLPQMVKMYFAYNNTLSYQKKAFIYANVIRNQEKDPRTFQNYRPVIEKFMVDQLTEGNINEDLSLIYRTFLNKSALNKRMAENLAKALFTYEVSVEDLKIQYVVVLHRQLQKEQKIPVTGKTVLVQMYTKDCQILAEYQNGMRVCLDKEARTHRLLESDKLFELCREIVPENASVLLYLCGKTEDEHRLSEENVSEFSALLAIHGVRDSYKQQVRQEILDFYSEYPKAESLYAFLMACDQEAFALTDKGKMMELMTGEGMCQEAFELVKKYGPEKIDLRSLVRICSRCIINLDYEENDLLAAFAWYCFEQEKYDEILLSYLTRYYDGPVENMKKLWSASCQFKLDTFELEEKLLMMLLFIQSHMEQTEEIFDSYRKHAGKKKILQAYAVFKAYDYFVRNLPVTRPVFAYIESQYEKGKEQQQICLLALLRWYASQESLTEEQKGHVQTMLEEFCYQGKQFAFFKKFDVSLLRPFQLQDKNYVEYRAKPNAAVYITWHMSGAKEGKTREISEAMKNMYEGIFVKEVTLFYGDILYYTISEEVNGTKQQVQTGTLEWGEENCTKDDTCYDLLNRLGKEMELGEEKAAKETVQTYLEQKCLADHLFSLV